MKKVWANLLLTGVVLFSTACAFEPPHHVVVGMPVPVIRLPDVVIDGPDYRHDYHRETIRGAPFREPIWINHHRRWSDDHNNNWRGRNR